MKVIYTVRRPVKLGAVSGFTAAPGGYTPNFRVTLAEEGTHYSKGWSPTVWIYVPTRTTNAQRAQITFSGFIWLEKDKAPLPCTGAYRGSVDDEPISITTRQALLEPITRGQNVIASFPAASNHHKNSHRPKDEIDVFGIAHAKPEGKK